MVAKNNQNIDEKEDQVTAFECCSCGIREDGKIYICDMCKLLVCQDCVVESSIYYCGLYDSANFCPFCAATHEQEHQSPWGPNIC